LLGLLVVDWLSLPRELDCIQCLFLGDEQQPMARRTKIHSQLDGYGLVTYECGNSNCRKKYQYLVLIDPQFSDGTRTGEATSPVLTASSGDIRKFAARAKANLSPLAVEKPPEAIPASELYEWAVSNFPNATVISGKTVALSVGLEPVMAEQSGGGQRKVEEVVKITVTWDSEVSGRKERIEHRLIPTSGEPQFDEVFASIVAECTRLIEFRPNPRPVVRPSDPKGGQRDLGNIVGDGPRGEGAVLVPSIRPPSELQAAPGMVTSRLRGKL